ncbi:MAG: hypothetical protein ACOYYS_02495 [Chloroflexota bacterium]
MLNPFQCHRSLRFPGDLPQLLFLVLFKPATLLAYMQSFKPEIQPETNLIKLWLYGKEHPELREVVKLSLFSVALIPWLLIFALSGILSLWNTSIDGELTAKLALILLLAGLMGGGVGGVFVALESSIVQVLSVSIGLIIQLGVILASDRGLIAYDAQHSLIYVGVILGIVLGVTRYRARGLALGLACGLSGGMAMVTIGRKYGFDFDPDQTGDYVAMTSIFFGGACTMAGWIGEISRHWGKIAGTAVFLAMGAVTGLVLAKVFDRFTGLAFSITYWIVCLRLYLYWLQAPWSWIQSRFPDSLRFSPVFWDELIWLPLPGLEQFLRAAIRSDRAKGLEAIAFVGESPNQAWAAESIFLEVVLEDSSSADTPHTIAATSAILCQSPARISAETQDLLSLLSQITVTVSNALNDDDMSERLAYYRSALMQIGGLRQKLELMQQQFFMAKRFESVLGQWASILRRELAILDPKE